MTPSDFPRLPKVSGGPVRRSNSRQGARPLPTSRGPSGVKGDVTLNQPCSGPHRAHSTGVCPKLQLQAGARPSAWVPTAPVPIVLNPSGPWRSHRGGLAFLLEGRPRAGPGMLKVGAQKGPTLCL